MLDNSWIKHYEKENYIDVYQLGCLSGAADFQKKAIKELKKTLFSGDYPNLSQSTALEVIKNLKA